jgi:hypothetical protein
MTAEATANVAVAAPLPEVEDEVEDWLPGTVTSSLLALESPLLVPLEAETEPSSEPTVAESVAELEDPPTPVLEDEDEDEMDVAFADEDDSEPADELSEPESLVRLPSTDAEADVESDEVEPSHVGSVQLPRSRPLSADRMAAHESTPHSLSMLPSAVAAVGSDVMLKPVAVVQAARLLTTVATTPESAILVAITVGSQALSARTTEATRAARAITVE